MSYTPGPRSTTTGEASNVRTAIQDQIEGMESIFDAARSNPPPTGIAKGEFTPLKPSEKYDADGDRKQDAHTLFDRDGNGRADASLTRYSGGGAGAKLAVDFDRDGAQDANYRVSVRGGETAEQISSLDGNFQLTKKSLADGTAQYEARGTDADGREVVARAAVDRNGEWTDFELSLPGTPGEFTGFDDEGHGYAEGAPPDTLGAAKPGEKASAAESAAGKGPTVTVNGETFSGSDIKWGPDKGDEFDGTKGDFATGTVKTRAGTMQFMGTDLNGDRNLGGSKELTAVPVDAGPKASPGSDSGAAATRGVDTPAAKKSGPTVTVDGETFSGKDIKWGPDKGDEFDGTPFDFAVGSVKTRAGTKAFTGIDTDGDGNLKGSEVTAVPVEPKKK